MANDQASDNATAPAGQPAGTAATGTAPVSDDLSAKLANLEKQHADLRTAYNRRDQEVSQLRRMASQVQTQQGGYETEPLGTGQDATTELRSRQELLEFKLDHPDWLDKWDKIQAVAADPSFAMHYRDIPNSRAALEAAYKEASYRDLRAENDQLKTAAQKLQEAKEVNRNQAFVSGQGAAMQPETIDQAALQKMTRKEMEEKFTKEQLLSGVL